MTILNENPNGYLATVEHGHPRVRPWGFMLEEGGKFYFCTNSTKEAYQQLVTTPYIEFATTGKKFDWVRIRGAINFTEDMTLKEKVIESNGLVKSIDKTADNPIFKVFYIEHGAATIADFSGQPPKTLSF